MSLNKVMLGFIIDRYIGISNHIKMYNLSLFSNINISQWHTIYIRISLIITIEV